MTGLFDGGPGWLNVPSEAPQSDAKYAWIILDAYATDPTWKPDAGTFLKTGLVDFRHEHSHRCLLSAVAAFDFEAIASLSFPSLPYSGLGLFSAAVISMSAAER